MRLHKDGEQFEAAAADGAARQAARSLRREVRNPILALPAMERIRALPPEAREALMAVLCDIHVDAAERAEHAWRTRKAPLAAYWRACSVYAGHIRRAVKNPAAFFA